MHIAHEAKGGSDDFSKKFEFEKCPAYPACPIKIRALIRRFIPRSQGLITLSEQWKTTDSMLQKTVS